jgi:hypothetical protein
MDLEVEVRCPPCVPSVTHVPDDVAGVHGAALPVVVEVRVVVRVAVSAVEPERVPAQAVLGDADGPGHDGDGRCAAGAQEVDTLVAAAAAAGRAPGVDEGGGSSDGTEQPGCHVDARADHR